MAGGRFVYIDIGTIESVWRDLRLGVRLLRKDALVSSAAVLSLGLAIGACTAAFSLIDALILRELPVRGPQDLVYLNRAGKNDDQRFSTLFSHPLFARVRDTTSTHMEAFSMSISRCARPCCRTAAVSRRSCERSSCRAMRSARSA